MAKYDHGGGCACGLYKECECQPPPLKEGDEVRKKTGDYSFSGIIVSKFQKLDGISKRVVVENAEGILHIFNETQLELEK